MKTIFIANRGEIALRIHRTARSLGYRVAIGYPAVDAELPYVSVADVAVQLDGPQSFRNIDEVVNTAMACGADLVHPGYGFLSENPNFARAVREAGMIFVGPSAQTIEDLGDKARARQIAQACGVAVVPGSARAVETFAEVEECAAEIGYPIMIKAASGGGGIGMAIALTASDLAAAFERVSSRAASVFADRRLIVERYIASSRHVEVQIMGMPDGQVIAFAERDCSVQRRHQKVIEETPSLVLSSSVREQMATAAVMLAQAVGYENAGTVEFVYDLEREEFFFLEMNTRLQVEHPITEVVHAVDLVAWQLSIAEGSLASPPGFSQQPRGHAIELRVYAEDSESFMPRPGRITHWDMPLGNGIRIDSGYVLGNEVTPYFDPMMAKIIVHAETREAAITQAEVALAVTRVDGPGSNLSFLRRVLSNSSFRSGDYETGTLGVIEQPKQ